MMRRLIRLTSALILMVVGWQGTPTKASTFKVQHSMITTSRPPPPCSHRLYVQAAKISTFTFNFGPCHLTRSPMFDLQTSRHFKFIAMAPDDFDM